MKRIFLFAIFTLYFSIPTTGFADEQTAFSRLAHSMKEYHLKNTPKDLFPSMPLNQQELALLISETSTTYVKLGRPVTEREAALAIGLMAGYAQGFEDAYKLADKETPSLGLPIFDIEAYCSQIAATDSYSEQLKTSCVAMENESLSALKDMNLAEKTIQACTRKAKVTYGSYTILRGCADPNNTANTSSK